VIWEWRGRAWVLGDNIPNDEGLMPLRMVREQEYRPQVLAKCCFEQIRPEISREAKPYDCIVAGRNFGYGNPHIQGFLGLKGLGVGLLVESMSRGPLRACVNAGVPVLVVPGITRFVTDAEGLSVDFRTGNVVNGSRGSLLKTNPLPEVMRDIVECGGGIEYMKLRLGVTSRSN